MAKKPDGRTKLTGLRRQAEELLRTTKRQDAAMPLKDVQQLVSELQMYELELKMQNEELRRTQAELEAARDRYMELYDFAPAGHLTLDMQGKIVEANLQACTLLRVSRKDVMQQSLTRFIAPDDADLFHRHCREILKSGTKQDCQVRLLDKTGVVHWIHLESLAVRDGQGRVFGWRAALLNISEQKQAEQNLIEGKAQLRAILDHSPALIFLKNLEGRYLDINQEFERTFHLTRQDIIGRTDQDIFPSEQAMAFRTNDLIVLNAGRPLQFEEVALQDDGPHTSIVSKFPLRHLDGRPYAICGITTDITERKRAAEALRINETFTRAVLNSLSALLCVLDKDGVVLRTNDAWGQYSCRNVNRLVPPINIGENYLDLCRRAITDGDSAAQAIVEGIKTVLRGSQPIYSSEYACLSSEKEQWFLMRVTPLKESKGVVISHTDISDRVRMGQELENRARLLGEKQEELKSLTGKLIEAREQECKRIARELHDDFNQRLAALSVELENLERSSTPPPMPFARQLAAIRGEVVRLSDDLHDLAYKLHPSLLDHVGLEAAVRDHIAEFTKRTGLPVRFIAREVPKALSPEIATNLFRVMQESLQNVSKHAKATDVTVKLSGSSRGIGVSVQDNGTGFDLEDKRARLKGLGLVSMQERTRGLGGFLRIHSFARYGTKVCAWIPNAPESA